MKFFFCITLLAVSVFSSGQQVLLKGEVVNDSGTPLPYTSVYSKSSRRIGTTVGKDGHFTIIVDKNDSIRFTRIGYSPCSYKATNGGFIKVELKQTVCKVTGNFGGTRFYNTHPTIYGSVIREQLHQDTIIPAKKFPIQQGYEEEETIFEKVEIGPAVLHKQLDRMLVSGVTFEEVVKTGEGTVEILFAVTEQGYVDSIKLLNGIDAGIDKKVLENLRNIKFDSAYQNGKAVTALCQISLLIFLRDGYITSSLVTHKWVG